MNAFDEIFDGAASGLKPIALPPRQKRGRANSATNPLSPAPALATESASKPKGRKAALCADTSCRSPSAPDNPEMQADHSAEPNQFVPAKKNDSRKAKPEPTEPSSSPIPRKRGRPARAIMNTTGPSQDANNSDGLTRHELLHSAAIGTGRVDHFQCETHDRSIDAAILHIVEGWKMRQRWHRAEKALVLQAKAICRAFCDGDKDVANAAYAAISRGEPATPELVMALTPFLPAIERFEVERKAIEKDLKKRAKAVPAYDWAMAIRGLGELNFVALVGECCVRNEDGTMRGIGDYRTVSALWKRMGVALVNGERQRKVADAEMAILHGYRPARRSVLFNVGECLIKAGGEYKELYDARKAYEFARNEEIRPIVAHRRAARYMTKRLLRKMYAQWRKETRGESGDPDEITLPQAAE